MERKLRERKFLGLISAVRLYGNCATNSNNVKKHPGSERDRNWQQEIELLLNLERELDREIADI